jgi:hypothetical protein
MQVFMNHALVRARYLAKTLVAAIVPKNVLSISKAAEISDFPVAVLILE